MEYYMAIKDSEMLPCAVTWMALDIIKQSEVSERKTSIIWCHLCMEPKKKIIQMHLYTNQKQIHKHGKQIYSYLRVKGVAGE